MAIWKGVFSLLTYSYKHYILAVMTDFDDLVRKRQQDLEPKEPMPTGPSELERYSACWEALQGSGIHIDDLYFLSNDSRKAIKGLVSSYGARGLKPPSIRRGERSSFLGFRSTVTAEAWVLLREQSTYTAGQADHEHTTFSPLFVTPELTIMAQVYPKSWERFTPASANPTSYEKDFNTETIVESVVDQLARTNTPWVEPKM